MAKRRSNTKLIVVFLITISVFFLPLLASAATDVIKLRHAEENTRNSYGMVHSVFPWIEAIEKATNGRVKFEVYDSQTLTKGPDSWESVKGGIADSAFCMHGFWPGMTPLADVMTLPLLPIKNAETASAVMWTLFEKFPSLREQFKGVKVLTLNCSPSYFLLNSKREIKTMEDIKGLKLRVTGAPPSNMMKLLGASPVSMGMPDTYLNIQKGVIDGMAVPWEALHSFRQYEVAKYFTFIPIYGSYASEIMNLDKWNSIPADAQKQIESECGLKGSKFLAKKRFDDIEDVVRAEIKKRGHEMIEYTPPPDEVEKWVAVAGKPLWEQWVKDMEAKGYAEAQEILDTALSLLEEFAK
ncbi:MAG: TRAP transporter substrate-binding protein [Deltaproteobacteria bacterium]|nr:TRAP transporter substrate-binding protein [Deltaproteobacteria bacterium]